MPPEEQTYRDGIKVQLDRIEQQTTKTNGRVRWLEKMVYLAIGGLGVLSIVVLPLLWSLIQAGKLL
jgi:hypothetical protein